MKRIFFALSLIILAVLTANAQFALPDLKYAYDDLEMYIDSATMKVHYNNHHRAYMNNLNKALENHPGLKNKPIEELIANIMQLPAEIQTSVRNNGGGYHNHCMFWEWLAPAGKTALKGDALNEIIMAFGSVDNFKAEFEKAALSRFGSGWVWLIYDNNKMLRIISTPNQDSPLMDIAEIAGFPILGLDVWEHAYYLKYQSNRANYAKAFWNVVNWDKVNEMLKKHR